jgi:hypothetical protein
MVQEIIILDTAAPTLPEEVVKMVILAAEVILEILWGAVTMEYKIRHVFASLSTLE